MEAQPGFMVQEIKYQALNDYLTSTALYLGMKAAHVYEAEHHPVVDAMVKSTKAFKRASLLEESVAVAASMEKLQQFLAGTYVEEESIASVSEESAAEISQSEEEEEEEEVEVSIPKKKKTGIEDAELPTSDDEDIENNEVYVQIEKIKTQTRKEDNDFEEMDTLMDADDKQARRKHLRFYTGNIANQKKKAVISGDADIAYKTAKKKHGAREMSDHDYTEHPRQSKQSKQSKQQGSADLDDYYRLAKKRRMKEPAATEKWMDEDTIQGPRKITYEMMKNRGLTPYRKKEQRNPRVKNRNKYERATKKLSSIRRQTTDPSQRMAYSGEATGIKSRLSRSIVLA